MQPDSLKVYRIDPASISKLVSKAIAWRVFSFVIVFGGLRYVQYSRYGIDWSNPVVYGSTLLILLVLLISYIRLAIRLKANYSAYMLTIGDNFVSCINPVLNDITLPFDNVTQVIKYRNGNLMICGLERQERIVVMRNISDYEEVLAQLTSIVPQGVTQPKWGGYFSLFSSVLTILLSVGFVLSKSLPLSMGCGTAFIAYLIWTIQEIKRSNFNNRSKQASLIVTALILLLVSGLLMLKVYRVAKLYGSL